MDGLRSSRAASHDDQECGSSVYTQQVTPTSEIEVYGNVIADISGDGVWLRDVQGVSVYMNNILNNTRGITLTGCVNVTVYQNDLVQNGHQASDDSGNLWDDGYPSGGNYWSTTRGQTLTAMAWETRGTRFLAEQQTGTR